MSTYALPLALWVAAWLGLLLCLFSDGWLDVAGAIVLTVPLFVLGLRTRITTVAGGRESR